MLPRELAEGWSGSRYYTPDQVRAALASLKVKGRVRPYGFAAFLEQEAYDSLADPNDRAVPYAAARRAFFTAAGVTPGTYAFEPAPNDYTSIIIPPDDGHSGHHW